jgi:hypothetical protein
MPTLPTDLRSQLEKVIIKAREISEIAAKSALEALAVQHHEPYKHMTPDQRELRNKLRARARQHGDRRLPKPDSSGNDHEISHLISECAYEHWHRMLFARFLAENGLLIEAEESVAISLAEARELAKGEGLDVWVYASRCAQRMLPQIFRPDDPLLQVAFAPEHILKLESLLDSIPTQVFTASDSLGWVYQFWQTKKKKEINESEVKIGADEISAVTQLFTEPYMVEFLIHNTLGAWWAGKRLTSHDREKAASEDELRKRLALPGVNWNYLRFVRGEDGKGGPWRPGAGTFDGWPKTAKEIKVMDPCCGSGHFLVAALHHLVPMRMTEEGLSAAEAVDAVLRDNLHGLEIDERCCQIAAFALAFAAWTYPDASGYRTLPELNIACTGIAPQATKEQWLQLAEKAAVKGRMPAKRDLFGKEDSLLSGTLANALEALYDLFAQAPILGSLIDPHKISKNLYQAGYETLAPLLTEVFKAESDDEARERAVAAAGMVKAAELLAGKYTLIITNVPYLGRGRQDDPLKVFLERNYSDGKADLATAFVLRCLECCASGGTAGMVTPQIWLFLEGYRTLREKMLDAHTWRSVVRLGSGAFGTIGGAVVNTALFVLQRSQPDSDSKIAAVDVSSIEGASVKDSALPNIGITIVCQRDQRLNPDSRITLADHVPSSLLGQFVGSTEGLSTGDRDRFIRQFWELDPIADDWEFFQTAPSGNMLVDGFSEVVYWQEGHGVLSSFSGARIQGHAAWGLPGVLVGRMSTIRAGYYAGYLYDKSCVVLTPKNDAYLLPILTFCISPDFEVEIRRLDKKLGVATSVPLKVPFDLEEWKAAASEQYPNGLPEPESDDPTQWLFHGRPDEAQEGTELQVAVARLLGYRWPAELDDKMRLSKRARKLVKSCDDLLEYADKDGIVCIPSVRGEEPAAERLLRCGSGILPLQAAGSRFHLDLDDWLRNSFFEEHCKLFHDRPFIWHIWDGRKSDGFHALVNYHKLAESNGKGRRLLENLTHSYLNDWITRQKDGVKHGVEGAEERLAAALELKKRLEAILEGEPPFDIFVRWKPLSQQAIGWEPDINDGVRLNIRPFLASDLPNGKKGAGILRIKPNIKWEKDRGKEPQRPKAEYPWFWKGNEFTGDRVNDIHLTNEEKRKARDKK